MGPHLEADHKNGEGPRPSTAPWGPERALCPEGGAQVVTVLTPLADPVGSLQHEEVGTAGVVSSFYR